MCEKPSFEAPGRVEEIPCPLCGSKHGEVLFSGEDLLHGLPGRFGVTRCGECGFTYTSPRPPLDELGQYYPQDYSPHQAKPFRPRYLRDALRRTLLGEYRGYPGRRSAVRRVLLWPAYAAFCISSKNLFWVPFQGEGRILDVGCGAGRFLWKLAREGWDVKGLDISETASQVARDGYGVEVAVGTYPDEHFPPGSFDVVTLWNSLEHMPDPVGVLSSCRKVLAAGGRMYISVPNFDSFGARRFRENWFPLDLPRHLNHFTAETIALAFGRAGLVTDRVSGLRRTSSLRRSARYALGVGDRRLSTRILSTRLGAGTAGRLLATGGQCDLMVVSAHKQIAG